MDQIHELKALLLTPKSCVVLSHRNPDGDALGSSLALSLFLQSLNHNVRVIYPSEYPLNFEWMPQTEEILIYDISQKIVSKPLKVLNSFLS